MWNEFLNYRDNSVSLWNMITKHLILIWVLAIQLFKKEALYLVKKKIHHDLQTNPKTTNKDIKSLYL